MLLTCAPITDLPPNMEKHIVADPGILVEFGSGFFQRVESEQPHNNHIEKVFFIELCVKTGFNAHSHSQSGTGITHHNWIMADNHRKLCKCKIHVLVLTTSFRGK